MVLANNEWLSNCEDEQKSAAASSATTTTTTAANTATTATEPISATPNTTATDTATVPANSATTITGETENANNEQFVEDRQLRELLQDLLLKSKQLEQQEADLTTSMLNSSDIYNIMAENTNEPPLKIKSEQPDSETDTTTATTTTTATAEVKEGENNNPEESILDENSDYIKATLNEISNAICSNFNLNTNTNLTLNSCSNTLQGSNARQSKVVNSGAPLPLSSPITPQALSSALQTVMNAANSATTTAPGNLQNTFLSSLGIGGANALALQQTAKQFTQLDAQANLNAPLPPPVAINSNVGSSCLEIADAPAGASSGQPKIVLLCETNSHPFQTRTILLTPNIECKVGRLIAKSKASESNAIFDCKVLSRNHAMLWYSDDGKFWVKDTKSSNGTFINENKLGTDAAELHFGDIVKFGVDVLENSRKEVHGCIIACVKLYLPDGREAISIDTALSTHRTQYSGEGRISFDELHRLNLYMQEVSQREKVLKSKLFNLQNTLDATRKNSAMCWQSLIAEDQLLHRIHSLEKKLLIMEKNVPESTLKNEVLKLLDDKSAYQHTAKEALRKVYQERCDALQMLAKMESAYTSSDNECKILRDQIMNTRQSLQDVNTRLLRLETEYNEYKEETERQQHEAKEQEDARAAELMNKLLERDLECEELRRKISELLLKRAELLDDEEQLQKQAIEKLDAAIADMDLGDDDDEDDDEDDEVVEHHDGTNIEKDSSATHKKLTIKERRKETEDELNGLNVLDDNSNSSGDSEKEKSNTSPKMGQEASKKKPIKHKVVKESTIMKWLQNSDLNKKEGSLDIFKAICNESDSSDEQESHAPSSGCANKTGAGANAVGAEINFEDFEQKCSKFTSKLQSVQKNLKQLEAEIEYETNTAECAIATLDDGHAIVEDEETEECITKRNGQENDLVLANENKRYMLLRTSVNMLREAYNEIRDNMPQQQKSELHAGAKDFGEIEELISQKQPQPSPPPAISVQTQFQNNAQHKPSNSAAKKLETQETLKSLPEVANEEQRDSDEEEEEDDDDEISDATSRLSVGTVKGTTDESEPKVQQHVNEIHGYQTRIAQLNVKLEQIESDAQNTLEIMQIECETSKDKVAELERHIEMLHDEKRALEQVISENKSNAIKIAESRECRAIDKVTIEEIATEMLPATPINQIATKARNVVDDDDATGTRSFEREMHEELKVINSNAMQQEEELIMYKERLEQWRDDNTQLRNEIAELKLKAGDYYTQVLLRRMLPYGAAVVAILVYFITTYF